MGKEETKQSDSDGVRRERKSKRKRRSERAIRVMHCARERLFANIFFGKQPIENKAYFCYSFP